VHHKGFGFHADDCAPGILGLLSSAREHNGLVVELGCGSGLLTRHLLDGGHRVIATDASPAMLDLARDVASDAEEIRRLTLPDDPIPEADAIVSVGHALSTCPRPRRSTGRLEQRREVGAGRDLRDLQLDRADPSVPPTGAVAVAVGHPLRAPLVGCGTDLG